MVALVLSCANAQACFSIPQNISVDDSSFTPAMNLTVHMNCGFRLNFMSPNIEQTIADIERKREAAFAQWQDEHSIISHSDKVVQKARDKIIKQFPLPQNFSNTIQINSDNKLCANKDYRYDDCEQADADIRLDDKIVGKIVFQAEYVQIFSVKNDGEIDSARSSLKIYTTGDKRARIETLLDGSIVGTMDIDGSECKRAFEMRGGIMELVGKSYRSNTSTCRGSFESRAYSPSVP